MTITTELPHMLAAIATLQAGYRLGHADVAILKGVVIALGARDKQISDLENQLASGFTPEALAQEDRAERAEARIAELEARTEQPPVYICREGYEAMRDILDRRMSGAGRYVSLSRSPNIKEAHPVYLERPAPATVTVKLPDEVLVLLNHLEDVLPSEAFELIDVKTWNAVSMLSATGIKIAEGE